MKIQVLYVSLKSKWYHHLPFLYMDKMLAFSYNLETPGKLPQTAFIYIYICMPLLVLGFCLLLVDVQKTLLHMKEGFSCPKSLLSSSIIRMIIEAISKDSHSDAFYIHIYIYILSFNFTYGSIYLWIHKD